jgi:hypothetical protein
VALWFSWFAKGMQDVDLSAIADAGGLLKCASQPRRSQIFRIALQNCNTSPLVNRRLDD